jgi:hypothetical protein
VRKGRKRSLTLSLMLPGVTGSITVLLPYYFDLEMDEIIKGERGIAICPQVSPMSVERVSITVATHTVSGPQAESLTVTVSQIHIVSQDYCGCEVLTLHVALHPPQTVVGISMHSSTVGIWPSAANVSKFHLSQSNVTFFYL